MNISVSSMSYGGSQTQRVHGVGLQGPVRVRQDQPGVGLQLGGGAPPGAPSHPTPTFASQAFGGDMLRDLLGLQEAAESGSEDPIAIMVQAADSDGDDALSLEEILQHLGDVSADALKKAMEKIDADGDDRLSADELRSAVDAKPVRRGPPPPTIEDLAALLIGSADADEDGGLTLDETQAAFGDDAADDVATGFGKLDTDGDGKLSAEEISLALSAFQDALGSGPARQRPEAQLLAV
jgi:Ca2+-binding EF-hand superfamily protein